jgi:hypothetical protein
MTKAIEVVYEKNVGYSPNYSQNLNFDTKLTPKEFLNPCFGEDSEQHIFRKHRGNLL